MDGGERRGSVGVGGSSVRKDPPACIIIGMAGSGKTTLMQRIASTLGASRTPAYMMNLDPAVLSIPYRANIDIREAVDYKQVMEQYRLGPNGAILTSLNLFAAQFQTVLELAEKRRNQVDYLFLDTPGQIEVFTWSASGSIITESLALSFPTCVLFVVDTVRSRNPMTFVSNMLYACSILYKTRLPLVVVFNKIDAERHDFAKAWMEDYEQFDEVLREESTFADSLARSIAIALEELYKNIHSVGVSAMTGEGIPELFQAIQKASEEYETTYKVEQEERQRQRTEEEAVKGKEELEKFRRDRDLEDELPQDTMFSPQSEDEAEEAPDPAEEIEKEELLRYVEGLKLGKEKSNEL